MIRIGIVDDHILTLKGIQQMLSDEEDLLVSVAFTDGHQLLNHLALNPESVDVLILDLNMPNINGVELCKKVRATYPDFKIIVLSMLDDVSLIERMIKYGANAYLLKNSMQDELVEAIHSVIDGKQYFNQHIRRLITFKSKKAVKSSDNTMRPKLSRRELEVLQLIVKEYTTPQIAEELFISQGTVITHRKHILSKMGVSNIAGMVRVAMDWGLIDP
ncbi:MAG: response regulator transcription factor [Saprospiraceae bacterium]|nr:response regulator transcription factor [Saprospiraceae bacterium]